MRLLIGCNLSDVDGSPNLCVKMAIADAMLQAQCNVFEGATGEVSLTAGGGLRLLPVLDSFENAALVITLAISILLFL